VEDKTGAGGGGGAGPPGGGGAGAALGVGGGGAPGPEEILDLIDNNYHPMNEMDGIKDHNF
jgi:hypothetical protein